MVDYKINIKYDDTNKTWEYSVKKRLFLFFYKQLAYSCLCLKYDDMLKDIASVVQVDKMMEWYGVQ